MSCSKQLSGILKRGAMSVKYRITALQIALKSSGRYWTAGRNASGAMGRFVDTEMCQWTVKLWPNRKPRSMAREYARGPKDGEQSRAETAATPDCGRDDGEVNETHAARLVCCRSSALPPTKTLFVRRAQIQVVSANILLHA
jgi:hypothetical protein